jgi:hypothetical protein
MINYNLVFGFLSYINMKDSFFITVAIKYFTVKVLSFIYDMYILILTFITSVEFYLSL